MFRSFGCGGLGRIHRWRWAQKPPATADQSTSAAQSNKKWDNDRPNGGKHVALVVANFFLLDFGRFLVHHLLAGILFSQMSGEPIKTDQTHENAAENRRSPENPADIQLI